MDDPPPLALYDSDDSDSGYDEDRNKVSVNPRHRLSVTSMSDRRVRPPDIINVNAMKVKELNDMKTNNDQELSKNIQVRRSEQESLSINSYPMLSGLS
jgi:hypothetical protein